MLNATRLVPRVSTSPFRVHSNVILQEFSKDMSGSFLDVGCTNDKNRCFFYEAYEWVTYDLKEGADVQSNICREVFWPKDTPLPFQYFDNILCVWLLEHVVAPDKAIRNMAQLVKPGGTLILGLPTNYPYHAFPEDNWRYSFPDIYHLVKDYFVPTDVRSIGEVGEIHLDDGLSFWKEPILIGPEGYMAKVRRK